MDYFNQTVASMKSTGHLICISSANSGTNQMYIRHQSTGADYTSQWKTFLAIKTNKTNAAVDTWSKSSDAYYIRMAVVDTITGEVLAEKLYAPSEMTETTKDTTYTDSTTFAKYIKGKIIISGSLNNNNRYNNFVSIDEKSTVKDPPYRLSMDVYAKKGSVIEAWECTGLANMKSYNLPGYISGTDSCSANSMCYNDNNICVGAYVTRQAYYNPVLKKNCVYGNVGETGDMAYFSSYGIKDEGTVLPDIVAPGATLISSYNSYNRDARTPLICDSLIADDGHIYYWGAQAGTSMATPVVTGIIATWLQCKPTLTVDEIKTILDATAVDDYYVKKYNHVKSGRGKIDAYAGLRYLLTTNIGNPACAQHQVLIYPSADGKVNIYAQGETGNIHVGVYAASGITVLNRTIATTDGSAVIDLGSNMPKGLYIIKVEGVKARGSNTLTVR